MNSKISTKKIVIYIVGLLIWIIYFIQSYKLYSQISTFVTPGSSYVIQLLEFTNYRASELLISLVAYFILIVGYSFLSISAYKKADLSYKKKVLLKIILEYIIIWAILLWISTIFFPIYIILSLLANIIIIASFYVSSILFGSKITFEKDDIVFKSNPYRTSNDAQKNLDTILNKMNEKYDHRLQGTIFEDTQQFYFEIYALSKITLDSKGDLQLYEDF